MKPCDLLYTNCFGPCAFRETDIPVTMTAAHGGHFARLPQLLLAVLPHRLQQPVACLTAALLHEHQRFIDQGGEDLKHVACFAWLTCAAGLCRFERKTASKHREPAEEGLLLCYQQVVAPVHGC